MRCSRILMLCLIAACDVSPTAIESLDRERLEQLATRATPAGPAQRMWLDLIDSMDGAGLPEGELPGVDSLFAIAVAMNGDPSQESASRQAEHRAILDHAWQQIERGNTSEGERELVKARALQAETIVRSLGSTSSQVFMAVVGRTLNRAHEHRMQGSRADERRLRAMELTARDLLDDAREHLIRGNTAAALSVSLHAADLTNALMRALREPARRP